MLIASMELNHLRFTNHQSHIYLRCQPIRVNSPQRHPGIAAVASRRDWQLAQVALVSKLVAAWHATRNS